MEKEETELNIIHPTRMQLENYISMKTYMDTELRALEKATTLAAENLKVRLDGLNEWRAQNRDERAMYLTRIEYDAKHLLLEQKIETLQKFAWIGLGAVLLAEIILRFIK